MTNASALDEAKCRIKGCHGQAAQAGLCADHTESQREQERHTGEFQRTIRRSLRPERQKTFDLWQVGPTRPEWSSENQAEINCLLLTLLESDPADEWIGVDLDGTLAKDTGYKGATKIGEIIPKMAARVRRWVGRGKKVKIFTARADDERSVNAIKKWLKDNELPDLEITNLKSPEMKEFWDDKAVAVEKNTGEVKESETEDITAAVFNAMSADVVGIKRDGDRSGHYVFIPASLEDGDEAMAIGPFTDQETAQTFLDSEVGAPGAKIVVVGPERPQLETLGKAPTNITAIAAKAQYKADRLKAKGWTPRDFAKVYIGGPKAQKSAYDDVQKRLAAKVVEHLLWEMPQWQPSHGEIAWFRNMLQHLSPRATWAVPATGQIYAIDQPARKVTLIRGDPNDPDGWHQKTKIILQSFGYTVHDQQEPPPGADGEMAFAESLLLEHPEIKTLKDNQVKLDPEERAQVMKAGAVWHMGKDGAASPAVRKAVVKGKVWYWCATHRFGQVRKTLQAAIKTFPAVKETA